RGLISPVRPNRVAIVVRVGDIHAESDAEQGFVGRLQVTVSTTAATTAATTTLTLGELHTCAERQHGDGCQKQLTHTGYSPVRGFATRLRRLARLALPPDNAINTTASSVPSVRSRRLKGVRPAFLGIKPACAFRTPQTHVIARES